MAKSVPFHVQLAEAPNTPSQRLVSVPLGQVDCQGRQESVQVADRQRRFLVYLVTSG